MTVKNNMLQLFDLVTMFILCYNWHICSRAWRLNKKQCKFVKKINLLHVSSDSLLYVCSLLIKNYKQGHSLKGWNKNLKFTRGIRKSITNNKESIITNKFQTTKQFSGK